MRGEVAIERLVKVGLVPIAVLLAAAPVLGAALILIDAQPGTMIVIPELAPDVRALRARVARLDNVERIEVFFKNREWIRTSEAETEPLEPVFVITSTEEIQPIVDGFREAKRFAPYWTQCGFYIYN